MHRWSSLEDQKLQTFGDLDSVCAQLVQTNLYFAGIRRPDILSMVFAFVGHEVEPSLRSKIGNNEQLQLLYYRLPTIFS